MQLIVSSRHFDASDALLQHVEDQFRPMDKYESRISRIEVTLLKEKNRRDVEALCIVEGGSNLHAEAQAGDFRTAVDQASDRLARQLRKLRSQHRDHQGPPNGLTGAMGEGLPEELP